MNTILDYLTIDIITMYENNNSLINLQNNYSDNKDIHSLNEIPNDVDVIYFKK